MSEYNRQERFYSKHNHYATNKLNSYSLSATKENHPFTIQALENSHRKRGFNGIGYHYYIRQNGEVINTRPLSRIGAHAKGYIRNTIGICYEGGLDKDGKPKDTRTLEQRAALRRLIIELQLRFPGCKICGIVTSVPT